MAPKAMLYAVAGGPHPGIYSDWSQAQSAAVGKKGAKVKKFADKESAEAFIAGVRASVDPVGANPSRHIPAPKHPKDESKVFDLPQIHTQGKRLKHC